MVQQGPVPLLYQTPALLWNFSVCLYSGGQTKSHLGVSPLNLSENLTSTQTETSFCTQPRGGGASQPFTHFPIFCARLVSDETREFLSHISAFSLALPVTAFCRSRFSWSCCSSSRFASNGCLRFAASRFAAASFCCSYRICSPRSRRRFSCSRRWAIVSFNISSSVSSSSKLKTCAPFVYVSLRLRYPHHASPSTANRSRKSHCLQLPYAGTLWCVLCVVCAEFSRIRCA